MPDVQIDAVLEGTSALSISDMRADGIEDPFAQNLQRFIFLHRFFIPSFVMTYFSEIFFSVVDQIKS